MNKSDIIFVSILIVVSVTFFIYQLVKPSKIGTQAVIIYQNEKVLTVPLNKNQTYQVDGKLGSVTLEVKDNKIRVIDETSPNHICRKQGFIRKKGETLVCLPNQVIVQIEGDSSLDTIVR